METAWYTTRERVLASLDAPLAHRRAAQVDAAIGASTASMNTAAVRDSFAPWEGTRYFDYPCGSSPGSVLYLGQYSLMATPSVVTAGGVAVTVADLLIGPPGGAPYTFITPRTGGTADLHQGDTFRARVGVTGVWGYGDDRQDPAGNLVGAISSTSATTLTLTTGAAVGVGSIIRVGTERMTVTGRSNVTTGQTVQTPMGVSNAGVSLAVTTGSAYAIGETLVVDAERMRVADIVGNVLVVDRAVDGSVLAAHTGSTIYASRTYTVRRGDRGTAATTHADNAAVTVWTPAPGVESVAVALAQHQLMQELSGYARTVGTGEGTRNASGAALNALIRTFTESYGRRMRHSAV